MKAKRGPQQARLRAELILQVRAGAISVTQAARRLGISRKTYYQWEQRGLAGLLQSLEERPGGRPPQPMDKEKEALRRQVKDLEKKLRLLQQGMKLRELLREEPTAADKTSPPQRRKKKERATRDDP